MGTPLQRCRGVIFGGPSWQPGSLPRDEDYMFMLIVGHGLRENQPVLVQVHHIELQHAILLGAERA